MLEQQYKSPLSTGNITRFKNPYVTFKKGTSKTDSVICDASSVDSTASGGSDITCEKISNIDDFVVSKVRKNMKSGKIQKLMHIISEDQKYSSDIEKKQYKAVCKKINKDLKALKQKGVLI